MPTGVREVNPAIRGDLVGGLWCRNDAVVEPGSVLGALRATLEATGRYRWLPGRQAVDVQPTDAADRAHRDRPPGRRHQGRSPSLCIGDRLSGLGGRVGAALATRRSGGAGCR